MAVWRRGEGVTRCVCCMERHTAKYSEIQPNSIQPAIQPCRACRGSGAWPGCAQAAVHAAMGAGYRPTPSVTPSSPTGTLSACVSVRHLVLYSRNTIQLTIQLYGSEKGIGSAAPAGPVALSCPDGGPLFHREFPKTTTLLLTMRRDYTVPAYTPRQRHVVNSVQSRVAAALLAAMRRARGTG